MEDRFVAEKRRQPGVAFPSANDQEHIFIIRFDISDFISDDPKKVKEIVRTGLRNICQFFDKISKAEKKIDEVSEDGYITMRSLSDFKFSATIGFGIGFFKKLNIVEKNLPRKLKSMPDFLQLADMRPYSLSQTDFIIQLGADEDYINRWVFQNQIGITKVKRKGAAYNRQSDLLTSAVTDDGDMSDIYSIIRSWAKITDIHAGFQRLDGKNLLGFNDGISNPSRLSNNVVWTTGQDEVEKFRDGTYMVFQKIEHDLDKWRNLDEEKQERWIGRSKGTGLLLGTLSRNEDQVLASDMHSSNELKGVSP